MTLCRHELDEQWCGVCRKVPPPPLVLEGPTVPSRFAGKCSGCGDRIEQGEDIHLTDHGWVCTSCARRAVTA